MRAPTADGRARVLATRARAWVLLLAAVFALFQLAGVTGRATPDTRNYVSYALALGGAGVRESAGIRPYPASRRPGDPLRGARGLVVGLPFEWRRSALPVKKPEPSV